MFPKDAKKNRVLPCLRHSSSTSDYLGTIHQVVSVISKATYPSTLTVLSLQHLFVNSDRMTRGGNGRLSVNFAMFNDLKHSKWIICLGERLVTLAISVSSDTDVHQHQTLHPLASRLTLRHDFYIFTKCLLRGLMYIILKTPALPPPMGPYLRPSVSVSKLLSPL